MRFKIIAALCIGLGTLTACQTIEPLVGKASDAADGVRAGAEFTLCNGITVGAWRRAYSADPKKSLGWSMLCNPAPAMSVPTPLPQQGSALGDPHQADI